MDAQASSGRAVLEQAWSYRPDGNPVAVFDSETGSRTLDVDSSGVSPQYTALTGQKATRTTLRARS